MQGNSVIGDMPGLTKRCGLIIGLIFAAAVIILLATVFWVGYQGSDDGSYIDGALAWYYNFPHIGHSHWDLRYPVLFAIDAGFLIFGINEFAVGVSMLMYLFGLVAVSVWLLQRWFSVVESLIFIVIFCAMPGVTVAATFANADIPELFYVVASVALYCAALESTHSRSLLFAAGLAAGLAFATRETTLGLIAAYGLLFLFRPGVKRAHFFLIAFGFVLMLSLEWLYYGITVGHPLWRYTLDVQHGKVDRSAVLPAGQALDLEGNLGGALSPLLMFFASQKYALIFYSMLGFTPLLLRSSWNRRQQDVLIATAALFVGWAGHVLLNGSLLLLVPRYFLVTAWVASILTAIGLGRLWTARPRLTGGVLLALLLSDAACLYVENLSPNQASRAAITVALENHEPVYTDSLTRRRGRFIAQNSGIAHYIIAAKPPPGSRYVLAIDNLSRCRDANCEADRAVLTDIPHWKEIKRIVPAPRAVAILLESLNVRQLIPGDIYKKLVRPNSGVVVYRVE